MAPIGQESAEAGNPAHRHKEESTRRYSTVGIKKQKRENVIERPGRDYDSNFSPGRVGRGSGQQVLADEKVKGD